MTTPDHDENPPEQTEVLDAVEHPDEPDSTSTGEPDETAAAPGRRKRGKLLAVGIAALLVLGGTASAVAAAHKTVDVDVDGETISVSTFSGSVAGLLADEGITLGEHDLVVPGVDEPLTDGSEVVVRYAEQIQVTLDGAPVNLWTVGDTTAQALTDLAASGRTATVTASRSEGRLALDLPLVQDGPVIFEVDGDSRTVDIEGVADLGTALLRAEIEVGDSDRVSISTADDGTPVVTITRIATEENSRTESIDFETVERSTDDLYEDQSRVVSEGSEGERTYTYVEYKVDGKVVSSRLVSTEVTTEPEDRVVEYGTAERPAPEPTSSGSGSSGGSGSGSGGSSGGSSSVGSDVWAALAQCESGGNPTTNTGNGYYGLYQFSLSTWQAVGGSGLPSEASAAEQTERAKILQARAGWGQWPACSAKLGLR
ncbi:transglycosylase family protein [Pseudactinotalea sp.]|uniref:transglycosylase family protein n=1 Tax=Pseudactinotalea sp. TaxID=1926260 RepID=UPI003B3BE32E